MNESGSDSGSASLMSEGGRPGVGVDPLRVLAEKQVLQGIQEASLSREAAFSVAAAGRRGLTTMLALTLGPEDFLTSMNLWNLWCEPEHGVLSHVQRLMVPEAEAVTATLLHLSIYQEVGGAARGQH